MRPSFTRKTWRIILITAVLTGISVGIAFAGGNDFIEGTLRTDLAEIYNAGDYRVTLLANYYPTNSGIDFTTAWFAVFLGQFNGQTYSGLFSQVGLLTQSDGVHWFVYTEAGATCLAGNSAWGNLGCEGNAGDLVSLQNWYQVELKSEGGGWWLFRLYDTNGNAIGFFSHRLMPIYHWY